MNDVACGGIARVIERECGDRRTRPTIGLSPLCERDPLRGSWHVKDVTQYGPMERTRGEGEPV